MIKGAQKQMIVLRTQNSRYFDEAYFVLRRDIKNITVQQNDMIHEANRILTESAPSAPNSKSKKKWGWLLFAAGLVCGIGCALLLLLFL